MNDFVQDKNGIWVTNEASIISYPDKGNDDCFAIEENSFWFKHRNNILKEAITRFPFTGNFSDIGGGNGYQAKFIADNFPTRKVFLIEPGYQGCLNGRKRGLENVYNITFQKFDFITNNVNAVGLFDVIEHIEDDITFLKELKLSLPPGSHIYISVPAHMYLWSDVDDFGGHFRRYDKKMATALSKNAGLQLVFFSYFFSYIPPITYFLRSIPYKIRGKRSESAILSTEGENHQPSKVLLSVFNFFHSKELRKIKNDSIGRGASCLIILKT